jgi:hypothetical protein
MNYRNRKLLDLARDQACAICGAEDGTVVAAHSNSSTHGKGKSLKSHDCFIAFLCYRCHMELDQGKASREEKEFTFRRAMDATTLRLWQQGRIRVK